MVDNVNAREQLISWRGSSAQYFTWFYIGTRPVWFFFVLYMAYRFGHVKLGPKDAKPEFSNTEYFTMLFAAGVAVGLFFYGVSEPLWHQNSHWFANSKYRNQDVSLCVRMRTKSIFLFVSLCSFVRIKMFCLCDPHRDHYRHHGCLSLCTSPPVFEAPIMVGSVCGGCRHLSSAERVAGRARVSGWRFCLWPSGCVRRCWWRRFHCRVFWRNFFSGVGVTQEFCRFLAALALLIFSCDSIQNLFLPFFIFCLVIFRLFAWRSSQTSVRSTSC